MVQRSVARRGNGCTKVCPDSGMPCYHQYLSCIHQLPRLHQNLCMTVMACCHGSVCPSTVARTMWPCNHKYLSCLHQITVARTMWPCSQPPIPELHPPNPAPPPNPVTDRNALLPRKRVFFDSAAADVGPAPTMLLCAETHTMYVIYHPDVVNRLPNLFETYKGCVEAWLE